MIWLGFACGVAASIVLTILVGLFMRTGGSFGTWELTDALAPHDRGSAFLDADPVSVAPRPPTEIPHQAISVWPACPICGREADVVVLAHIDSSIVGYGCNDHGLIRPDPTMPDRNIRGWV